MIDYTEFPELLRIAKRTDFVRGAQSIPPDSALKIFSEEIRNCPNYDYGDFMRSANLYICNLRRALSHCNEEVLKKIDEMQFYTQYSPDWNIESTRSRLLEDSDALGRLIICPKRLLTGADDPN